MTTICTFLTEYMAVGREEAEAGKRDRFNLKWRVKCVGSELGVSHSYLTKGIYPRSLSHIGL